MQERTHPAGAARGNGVLVAAVLYFLVVFLVGLLLGPVRVLWLEPILGPALAVLIETPFLLAAMVVGARLAPGWAKLSGGWPSYLGVGLIALVLQQVADLGVGFGLRQMNLAQQLAYFQTPAGWIYAFNLMAFASMPLIIRYTRGRSQRTPRPPPGPPPGPPALE